MRRAACGDDQKYDDKSDGERLVPLHSVSNGGLPHPKNSAEMRSG